MRALESRVYHSQPNRANAIRLPYFEHCELSSAHGVEAACKLCKHSKMSIGYAFGCTRSLHAEQLMFAHPFFVTWPYCDGHPDSH